MIDAGLYVHIPFCDVKCRYCDFATVTGQHQSIDSYLKALLSEAKAYSSIPIKTLFIGGGTPTVLSPVQIDYLFKELKMNFEFTSCGEMTVEANPESATYDVLCAYWNNGINRLSMGLQASQNRILNTLGRLHDWEKFLNAFETAQKIGFTNLNIDLMFGLPNQTLEDWIETLRTVIDLSPSHISAYALKVESGTAFGRDQVSVDPDLQADMYLAASDLLSKNNFHHYEISNFCRPGMESQHNLRYWKNLPTIGLGVSAASYWKDSRTSNTRLLPEYMKKIANNERVSVEHIQLNEEDREKENLMLGLRLDEGVPMEKLNSISIPTLPYFLKNDLAKISNGRVALSAKGWLVSNELFRHLI